MRQDRRPHLRSSFIYLANAVRDLTANWQVFALTLGPLAIVTALCLMPDALELQRQLSQLLSPNLHTVRVSAVVSVKAQPLPGPTFPSWGTRILHYVFLALTVGANLLVLCALARIRAGIREASAVKEALAVYRRAATLVGPFLWVFFLQVVTTVLGLVLLVVPGVLAYVWLYFAQYAVVMDDQRSWPALLFSRELMRGCFFAAATRIVVFLAVWSGFNSWTGGAFVLISWLLGFIGVMTGFVWLGVFLADLLATSVGYVTIAFFFAAGARLYEDLNQLRQARIGARVPPEVAVQQPAQNASTPTEPLSARLT